MQALRSQLEAAERDKEHLKEMMDQKQQESHQAGQRKTHLKHTLLGALRSQAQDTKNANQIQSLAGRIAEAEAKEKALQSRLQHAEEDGKKASEQSHADGQRKAHLKHSLLGHLRSTAQKNVHTGKVNQLEQRQKELETELEQTQLEHARKADKSAKGMRQLDLKHKLFGHLKSEASKVRDAVVHSELQAKIDQAEAKKIELMENLETERIRGEEASKVAHNKGLRKSDLKNKLLFNLRKQAAEKKHGEGLAELQAQIDEATKQQEVMKLQAEQDVLTARREGAEQLDAAVRKTNLKNKLLGHLKREAMGKKFATEKEALEHEKEMMLKEKNEVNQVLEKTKTEAASALAEAEVARKKERKMRLKMALKNHLKSEAEKDKEKLKAGALKTAALAATERATALNKQLEEVKELAVLQAAEAEKKLKKQRIKGSLFAHLKKESAAKKVKASRMSDVRKLMKKHGTGILEKVRTNKEREKDKQKLAAMKEALVLKEKAAEEEKARIEAEQKERIIELEKQHEEVKKQMEEEAKAEAERVVKATRTTEVKGLFKKHRGNLLAKAKAVREARLQQENLAKLMKEIEDEKAESERKVKEAEEQRLASLEEQKLVLETHMEEERIQHAAELEQEQQKLEEDKKIALKELEISLAEKAEEDKKAAVEGAVKAATKKTFKGLLGKHAKNLKRVADLEKEQAKLKETRERLEKQEADAAEIAEKAKKTRFSSMLARQKGNIGRMATLSKERQRAQAKAEKATNDLTQLKSEKEGAERKSRFTSMFSRAAAKSKAQTLQSETEKLKKKWNERPDLRRMIESHDKMAALFRAHKTRKEFPGIRAKQLVMKEERSTAASQLQKIARGLLGRRKFERTKKLAWYDRPKTDATTNTMGYAHSTQQTLPAGALMLSDMGRQPSIDSLDSARDLAERQGALSDDSIEDLGGVPEVESDRQRGSQRRTRRGDRSSATMTTAGQQTTTRRGEAGDRENRVSSRSRHVGRRKKNGDGSGGRGSPLSALYRYTSKKLPDEITAYDPEFPSNRDDLINAAIETLMQ